jgi:hypothetical protein
MRYIDGALAWILLLSSIVVILYTEIAHPRGAVLDTPFFWLVISIINLVRLRNTHSTVPGLRKSSIAANLIGATAEIVRFRLFGITGLIQWGPQVLVTYTAAPYTAATIAILGELLFSVFRKNDSGAAPARL